MVKGTNTWKSIHTVTYIVMLTSFHKYGSIGGNLIPKNDAGMAVHRVEKNGKGKKKYT